MKRALICVGEGYGNIVMATPTIFAVRSLGYAVDVLVESYLPDAATLLAGWDTLETIYLTRQTVRRAEVGRGYDAVVRTRWNGGEPLGVGPEFGPDSLPYNHTHEAVLNLSATRALGYAGPIPPTHVESELPFWPLPERFLSVAPGYGGRRREDWARKAWPHWPEFCDRCHEETGADILVLGAERDAEPWMERESKPWLHNLCGRTSIRGAAGVLARSEALVALDNGLAHIGAALGRPVVALFGATSEVKNRPLGAGVRVVTADVDCRPCQMGPNWEACSDWQCMRQITVEDVLAELEIGSVKTCALTNVH